VASQAWRPGFSWPGRSSETAAPARAQEQPAKVPSAQEFGAGGALQLILDSSGSTAAQDPSGGTKIDAARAALGSVVDALPESTVLGVRAYGGTFEDKERGCGDTRLLVGMGPLDRAAAKSAFAGLKPLGFTPIATSLEKAAADFSREGARRILLISDGEETCGGNPCEVAKTLEASGIDLTVDTVGYAADAATKQQLACIAEATGGTYSEVADGAALQRELTRVAARAFRDFTPTGTPVSGTPTPAGAPLLEPGQYVDSFASAETKHYAITLPAGVTPYIAATSMPPRESLSGYTYDFFTTQLSSAQGICDGSRSLPVSGPATAVVTTGRIADGPTTRQDGCGSPGTYLLTVERTGSEGTKVPRLSTELVVLLEPPVEDAVTLPPSVASVPLRLAPPAPDGPGTLVTGAAAFGDAPVLDPGTYSDALRPGETSYYRVPVGWGQRFNVTAVIPPAVQGDRDGSSAVGATMAFYNPARQEVDMDESTGRINDYQYRLNGSDTVQVHGWTAPYTWRHRESSNQISTTSLAGEQYIELAMGQLLGSQEGPPLGIPVRLVVEVLGDVAGAPTYRATSGTEDPATPADRPETAEPLSAAGSEPVDAQSRNSSSDTRRISYATGGVVAALLAVGLLLLPWLRGRRRA
jgi:Ca-activated chloride channel family protein